MRNTNFHCTNLSIMHVHSIKTSINNQLCTVQEIYKMQTGAYSHLTEIFISSQTAKPRYPRYFLRTAHIFCQQAREKNADINERQNSN